MWPLVTPSRQRRWTGTPRPVVPVGFGRTARRWRIAACCPSRLAIGRRLFPTSESPVEWTAESSGHGSSPVYQFSVGPQGAPLQVVQDFSSSNSFIWNPMQQGTYEIQVVVKNGYRKSKSETAGATYTAQTRVVGNSAVVSPMANPLVALFSAPPSPGASMYVQFAQQSPNPSWQATSPQPIVPGESTNFIVAGMMAKTTYLMRYVLDNGTVSAPLTFTTGSMPAGMIFPKFTVVQPPAPGTDLSQGVIFHAGVVNYTMATDLNGNVIWYYDFQGNNFPSYAPNLEPGGTLMLLGGTASKVPGGYDTLRQVDLAGDTLRQTDVNAINAELAALHRPRILDLDHEAKLLPNGDTVVIATTPRTVLYHGRPTYFRGNMVLVLDQNFQVSWVWNAFNRLNTNRIGTDHSVPNDWLHANAVSWSPEDDNLIVSLRSQDWVIKIDYADGAGDGHIVWKLGQGGNFQAIAGDTSSPWFSHQHDARMINDTTLLVFDDGNTRQLHDKTAHSRGQEWILDEANGTATLAVDADLGNYSFFLGSSEMLPNGNLAFTSGGLGAGTNTAGQSIEVLPNGSIVYVQQMSEYEYRSYFESSLYSADLLD